MVDRDEVGVSRDNWAYMWSDLFDRLPLSYEANENAMLILSDALDILRSIRSDSIHLIFADPPYNIGKDFGNGSHRQKAATYLSWCQSWIDECCRVLHPNGTLYFMAATQFMPYLDVYTSERYSVLCRIVWTYDSSGVQSKKKFGSLYEPIVMVVKNSRQYTFNAEDIAVEARTGAVRRLIDYRKTPPQPYSTTKVPGNVWQYNRVRYRMPEYENHPAQKPEALLERVILASSNIGDIVLDPFGGTFTTAAVASRLNRRTISIDVNETYFKIGLRRLGIATLYNGESLVKDKGRKTHHKSKKDHQYS